MANFKLVVDELAGKPPKYSQAYKEIAALGVVGYDYVYQLHKGKSGKNKVSPELATAMGRAFAHGRAPGWFDRPPGEQPLGETAGTSYAVPLLVQAIGVIANVMENSDELGRQTVAGLLGRLATRPEERDRIGGAVLALVGHLSPPTPSPTLVVQTENAELLALVERLNAISDPTLQNAAISKAADAVEDALERKTKSPAPAAAKAGASSGRAAPSPSPAPAGKR